MKALTLTQPWATLMAMGLKTVETRSWGHLYRGPLAIHAAKSLPAYARDFADDLYGDCTIGVPREELPRGAVVAVCRLVAIGPTEHTPPPVLTAEGELGDYSPNRFAWYTSNLLTLPEPIPATGSLGLWEWDIPFDTQRWLASQGWPPEVVYG